MGHVTQLAKFLIYRRWCCILRLLFFIRGIGLELDVAPRSDSSGQRCSVGSSSCWDKLEARQVAMKDRFPNVLHHLFVVPAWS